MDNKIIENITSDTLLDKEKVQNILDPERTGKTYNGVVFWKYKGETLWDRRKRIRGE